MRPVRGLARPVLLAVAAVVFVAAFVLGVRGLPDDVDVHIRWWALVGIALVGVPLTALVNGLEYTVSARLGGHRVRWLAATEVAVLASAANLLPIPGAALVRVAALRRLGATYRTAVSATTALAGGWLATALLLAGVLLVVAGDGGTAVVIAAAALGAAALGATGYLAWRLVGNDRLASAVTAIVAVELASVAVGTARYFLVLHALDLDVGLGQAAALTVSTVVASALGIFPGGLGIRELLAGAIAPTVGLPAAVGLLGVAVDRLVGLPVLAAMAGGLAIAGRAPPRGEIDAVAGMTSDLGTPVMPFEG